MSSLEIISTLAGDELLASNNPQVLAVIDAFEHASHKPESAVIETVYNLGGFYTAAGRFSHVMRLGEYAFKVSSPSSTASEEYPDDEPYTENTAHQVSFLDSLYSHLSAIPESGITTPRQYFAMRSARHSGCLAVQQFMDGWVILGNWTDRAYRFIGDEEAEAEAVSLSTVIKQRVGRAIGGTDLAKGLNDLRLDEPTVHARNFLVPRYHPYEPQTVPLCIIDQPKSFVLG
ncbi:MAG TPA: hypothetical protein VFT16_00200 [Candidatus Saccharimonadales bacterium]|nr:hypothetical protein [Candidatus Saccharimonadales bacterium]